VEVKVSASIVMDPPLELEELELLEELDELLEELELDEELLLELEELELDELLEELELT